MDINANIPNKILTKQIHYHTIKIIWHEEVVGDIRMVQHVEINKQNTPYWHHLSSPRKATDKIQ